MKPEEKYEEGDDSVQQRKSIAVLRKLKCIRKLTLSEERPKIA